MFTSSKYTYFILRFGLAVVFLWFGIDKFIHPTYWQTVWISPKLISIVDFLSSNKNQIVYASAVFEIIVGLSLVSGIFAKLFSLLAIFYLVAILLVNGLTEITVRDMGLLGGLLATLLWPNFRNRY